MKAVFGGMSEAYKGAVEFAKGGKLDLGAFTVNIGALSKAAGLAATFAVQPPEAAAATPGANESASMASVLTTAMRSGFEAGAAMLSERIVGAVRESFEGTGIEVTFIGGARGDVASRIVIGNQAAVNLAVAGV